MLKLNVKRESGRLYLYVDAKGLHDILDRLGVTSSGGMYDHRPRTNHAVADRANRMISTEVLLRKEYPAKYDLSSVFTEPPNIATLQQLTESGFEQTRKILEHYQPIDIAVSIQAKPPGGSKKG